MKQPRERKKETWQQGHNKAQAYLCGCGRSRNHLDFFQATNGRKNKIFVERRRITTLTSSLVYQPHSPIFFLRLVFEWQDGSQLDDLSPALGGWHLGTCLRASLLLVRVRLGLGNTAKGASAADGMRRRKLTNDNEEKTF